MFNTLHIDVGVSQYPRQTVVLKAKNSDSIKLCLRVVEQGIPVDLSSATNAQIQISMPDDSLVTLLATIVGDTLEILLPLNAFSQAGICEVEAQVFSASALLIAASFYYQVINAIYDDTAIPTQPEYPILLQLIADCEAILDAEAIRVANENQRIANELIRQQFEFVGSYDGGTAYLKYNCVEYNGSTYVALQDTTGNLPTNPTYWQLAALKGTDGSDGLGVPAGGLTGQVLAKKSDADNDSEWITNEGAGTLAGLSDVDVTGHQIGMTLLSTNLTWYAGYPIRKIDTVDTQEINNNLLLGHVSGYLRVVNACTVTITAFDNDQMPIGSYVTIVNASDGDVVLAPDTGVTLNSFENKLTIDGKFRAVLVHKVALNVYDVIGALK